MAPLWPLRLAARDDELLSSYLIRAAHRHSLSPGAFTALWWPDRPVWNRDLDRGEDTAWLADVAAHTGLSLDRVRAMTLDAPRRRFGWGSGDTPLILSAGIYHRTRVRHAVQFCPWCLTDEVPYLRRGWRYSFVLTCPTCTTPLLDACPHCREAIVPHRSFRWSLDACHACGLALGQRDLRGAAVPAAVHGLQTRLLARLASDTGATVGPWGGDDAFAGVRALIAIARHPDVLPALRSALELDDATISASRFERMRIADRAVLLETVAHWIADWPRTFFIAAGNAALTQRTFRRIAQPGDLARQVLRLPDGSPRDRTFVPVLQDPALKRLRRRNRDGYRRVRAARLLDATAQRR
ncbi:TniQ family protein [Methylobacterium sp. WL122]|nr:TniQ family protein [Methylobacterium sp. WL122]